MNLIQLELPERLDNDKLEIKHFIAAKLYESGRLSLGEAALVAGETKQTFSSQLGKYGVSVFNSPISDLPHDIENV